ncbi:MAG TPA: hypothetical protein VFY85_09485 [Gemmatimonadaceae bacterium]|nr:hypothetical protein [Gemmatimonadaceae bacterium]
MCFVACAELEQSELSRRNGADAIGAVEMRGVVERADADRVEWREPAPDEGLDLALIGVSWNYPTTGPRVRPHAGADDCGTTGVNGLSRRRPAGDRA